MAAQFYNGKRLSFDGQLCTVRYYGAVKGTKGEWLGVEWDDPERGKHSGENGGIRYFECLSKSSTAGSFVRPTRQADAPRTFVEALRAKYASDPFEDPHVQIVYVSTKDEKNPLMRKDKPIRISGKEVEEVGFDKIRKQLADLQELRIVILDGMRMSRPIATLKERQGSAVDTAWPENLTDIKETCPNIVELDLSRNLFEEWREIASICEQLEKLKSLRVDGNRFRDISLTDAEKARCVSAFANIKTLKLEDTLLSWQGITSLTPLFHDLTQLILSSNTLTYLPTTSPLRPTTLTSLSLEDNLLTSISSISPLTTLPHLHRLIIKHNTISTLTAPGSPLPVFSPSLTEVDLSYNEIASWDFIQGLEGVFPGLAALRIAHNPLYHSLQAADGRSLSPEDGYMLTIGRLGQLKSLNYSPITPKERLNSESYYLSHIALALTHTPLDLASQILASHPRYAFLCAEYGEPVITRSTSTIPPNSLAARLIKFTLHLGPSAQAAVKPGTPTSFVKEIPMGFSMYSVLGLVGKKVGLPPMKLRLVWETGDWVGVGKAVGGGEEAWDSESSVDDWEGGGEKEGGERVPREVEMVAGTRLVGTWIDGMEATVRVELK
ncbi:RNI-like protein [Lepidopterella palustris CBS 459.81]|uniref:RNI-like protein n=1 Tax=Lepidopterella palustris CBS 459.81 TaxID=1314670 RepID=A0A8E2E7P2_9PEZI|nr:RNI-like protein [Lepidopterella palustris CBS 459.81]